ncbi:IclR family transcriptional regulator [Pseudarthrobacter sp. AG30]|uniref:IclR family transcriptional regulator n=1 Tax=Pseudarthrobacter sp. AG30 TaxID=2249742 RepID=UPI001403CB5F|nr:IclR family transcriptional regulator [Pseudarthrobacter sp. AG30]
MVTTTSMGRGIMAVLAAGERHARGLPGGTVAEIAADLGKDRSQVSRSLRTAEQEGFLQRTPQRTFALDWSVLTDAHLLTRRRLHSDGAAALDHLAGQTDEGCFLGVLSGNSTVTVGESIPESSRMVGSWLGRPYPAYCSDAGQALFWETSDDAVRTIFAGVTFQQHGPNTPANVEEFLERLRVARLRGYSVVDEEAEPGLYSLAVPVRDFRGGVVAALQVVGLKSRIEPRQAEHAKALRSEGEWLEAMLGGHSPNDHP